MEKNYEGMSLIERLQHARVDFAKLNLNKSGYNAFAKFKYFELPDIEKQIDEILLKWGIGTFGPSYRRDQDGSLWVDLEASTFDTQENKVISIEAVNHSKEQEIGSGITYDRRYLLYILMHVNEYDQIDATIGKEEPKVEKALATPLQVETIFVNRDKLVDALKERNIKNRNDIKNLSIKDASELCGMLDGK